MQVIIDEIVNNVRAIDRDMIIAPDVMRQIVDACVRAVQDLKLHDERGVIGLGEPPVVSPGAVISNAVANAIGVRVPTLPLTPDRVLAALDQKGGK